MWRGGLGVAYLFPPLSSGGASIAAPCSVSTSRSSNRTCGFPASGSPTDVAFRHTLPALPGQLHLKPKLALESPHLLLEEVIGLRHSPDRCPLHKHIRSQAPSLHRHYPASRVLIEPVRHPIRPGLSLTGVRLVSIHHRWGFPCCGRISFCIHAFATYPGGTVGCTRCSLFPTTAAFPDLIRLPHCSFRGLLSVHCTLRPAYSRGRLATLYTGGFRDVVTFTSLLRLLPTVATLSGGTLTHWSSAPLHGAMDGLDEQDKDKNRSVL